MEGGSCQVDKTENVGVADDGSQAGVDKVQDVGKGVPVAVVVIAAEHSAGGPGGRIFGDGNFN